MNQQGRRWKVIKDLKRRGTVPSKSGDASDGRKPSGVNALGKELSVRRVSTSSAYVVGGR